MPFPQYLAAKVINGHQTALDKHFYKVPGVHARDTTSSTFKDVLLLSWSLDDVLEWYPRFSTKCQEIGIPTTNLYALLPELGPMGFLVGLLGTVVYHQMDLALFNCRQIDRGRWWQ